ncbi:redox-sensing transcriptional repressor [Flavimobilis soli]|uniref:Redox-sensing transcriptional repressor Rex n=1 Tax=Flavimobilis soli TaxID=442709 RepID=A0A2A9ECI8_9MICO|nr:redox-sensing transcriptional repressor Rex [Flavimobilis soli]PFG36513.1 redox-sensing transcriptional repressor [Flavimobilis soli]
MTSTAVPPQTLTRLPVYARVLDDLVRRGVVTASSVELAAAAGVESAQLRRDLSHLGSYGKRGVGYDVAELRAQLRGALGVGRRRGVVVVGVGNLGRAVASYAGLVPRGFEVVALVDVDPQVVGTTVAGVEVGDLADLPRLVAEREVSLAVLTVPGAAAQDALDAVAASGVRSVLSFAPRALTVPDGVALRSVDVAAELQILSYYLPPV